MDEKKLKYYHSLYEIAAALNSAGTTDHLLHVIVGCPIYYCFQAN